MRITKDQIEIPQLGFNRKFIQKSTQNLRMVFFLRRIYANLRRIYAWFFFYAESTQNLRRIYAWFFSTQNLRRIYAWFFFLRRIYAWFFFTQNLRNTSKKSMHPKTVNKNTSIHTLLQTLAHTHTSTSCMSQAVESGVHTHLRAAYTYAPLT